MVPTGQLFSKKNDSTPTTEPVVATGEAASTVPLTVGIGASAGGHEALEHIFTALPADCGLSFVVVMHLPADGPSLLADLLRRHTSMQVVNAEDGMPLCANTIHVSPPGKNLIVSGGRLRHHLPENDGRLHHPIDRFFTSLAADLGQCAIAVVLSGFGSDGSEGVKRIKERGGMVLIQDPETATNPFMPQNAMATGAADAILSAKKIAERLAHLAGERATSPVKPCLSSTAIDEDLHSLFTILQARTSHDFSAYKRNTVLRRIERRMVVNGTKELREYFSILEKIPQEAHSLCQELLIGVTSFFRDPDAFEILRSAIIPGLFADRDLEEPVRIWHACCATGEEAYSVAMLILEYLEQEHLPAKVQIFATDLDEIAVTQARAGIYADDIASEVGTERLNRFFTRNGGCWQVTKQLREMIVFAHHNIIKDPPFSRLDLLVCRNFLIYLNPDIQKLLIPLFHQVLKPGGVLFLGSAETIGLHSDLFTPVDKKWKIFARQGGKSRVETLFPFSGPVRKLADIERSVRSSEAQETATIAFADKLLMERYVPARVIINERSEVVHFSNHASTYLLTPEGKPTRDLLKMAREELRPALRVAIYKAFTCQQEITYRGIKVAPDTGTATINIIVIPLKVPPPTGKLALVIIEPAAASPVQPPLNEDAIPGDDPSRNSLTCHLEEQLRVTDEQLQSTCEQLETSNERFMLANEELMTVNEELQSTNEELQSTNEELVTVNSELQKKMEELNQSNSDLENLFTSSEIATIFLDRGLFIKRFSPAMAAIFDWLPADIGRPIHHLSSMIDWSALSLDAALVLENLVPVEREVCTLKDGRSFIMRVLPYRTTEGEIDGIVVTLVDISERKRAEEELRRLQDNFYRAFISSPAALVITRLADGKFLNINETYTKIMGYLPSEVLGRTAADMGIYVHPHEREMLIQRLHEQGMVRNYELSARSKSGEILSLLVSMESTIYDNENTLISTFVDITDRKRAEEALRQSELQYHTLFDTLIEGFCTIEMIFDTEGKPVDYRFLETNPAFEKQTGLHNVQGMLISDLAPDNEDYWYEMYGKVVLTGEPVRFENEAKAIGGHFDVCAYRIGGSKSRKVAILFNNITERKRAEETLILSEQRRSLALEAAQAGTWEWDLETNENIWSNELWLLYGLEPNSCQPSYEEWRKIVHPDDRLQTEQVLQEAVSHGAAYNTEWRVNLSGGKERWLMSRGRPLKDTHGRVVRYLGIVMDITERKRIEEEKKGLQAQLTQSQKMEAIGTLAGGIAHDFNNILTAVMGYTELARDASPSGSNIANDLDRVLEAGNRATNLVKQILAFSRETRTERIPLEPVPLIKEAIKLLRPALPSTITIKQQIDTATSSILADPTQIHQIVMNLCTNAFHAMEQTGGILEITLKNRQLTPQDLVGRPGVQTGTFVELSIGDTGPGIAPAIRDKIFEPYFTTKEVGKGTGMGLSIVHGTVTAMGGVVTCESELGTGAIFHVFLPALEGEVAAAIQPVAPVAASGTERILFIDDEEILAEMAKIMLERLGYKVTVRTNSMEALATFQNQPDQFDAVITDQTMPGITGIDLARRMLQIRPDLPIILCTGYSTLVNEEQAKAYGLKGFIMKPMSRKDIAHLLRTVLKGNTPG